MINDNYVTKEQLLKKYDAYKIEWAKWFYRDNRFDNLGWEVVKLNDPEVDEFEHIDSFDDYQHGLDEFDKMRGAASIAATLNVY